MTGKKESPRVQMVAELPQHHLLCGAIEIYQYIPAEDYIHRLPNAEIRIHEVDSLKCNT